MFLWPLNGRIIHFIKLSNNPEFGYSKTDKWKLAKKVILYGEKEVRINLLDPEEVDDDWEQKHSKKIYLSYIVVILLSGLISFGGKKDEKIFFRKQQYPPYPPQNPQY
ncbi:hypothetical protein JNO41_01190 ['Prunus avium' virescence phytoplasma]